MALSLHAVIQFVHFNFNAVEITRGQPGVYMSLKKIEVITIKKLLCYNFSWKTKFMVDISDGLSFSLSNNA